MKRIAGILLVVLIVASAMCGCGSSKSVDLNALMDQINSDFSIGGLEKIEDAKKLEMFMGVKQDDVKSFAAEYSPEATVYQEVILVEAVDGDAASRVVTALDNYLDSNISDAKSYSPESEQMLSKCEPKQSGNYVSLIIGDDAEKIQKVVDAAIG